MAGKGPAPKQHRRNASDKPQRGDWQATPGIGWQHGETPDPPDGLLKASRDTWTAWMRSWFAAHWTPDDLPGIRVTIKLHDAVERGERQRATELRLWCDNYGVTPKGQQDRRWVRPEQPQVSGLPDTKPNPYGHLRVAK